MTSTADANLATADEQHAELFGTTVSYVRASSTTSDVPARVAMREYEVAKEGGTVTIVVVREYLIVKADVMIDSVEVKPRKGDRIKETIGGVVRTFQVLPLAERPEVEEDDVDGRLWKIRTKEVGT